ncbi:hypothetical protein LTR86_005266 [Recurvomyces mirabilis]|nr:hypothetical protein LTR86_005266 [Recurvomyces mirabilis]
MDTTQLDQQVPVSAMCLHPVQGEIINIYHSCDPPGTQILHHFKLSKHKISYLSLDPYATSPSLVLLPTAGGKFKAVTRCVEGRCEKCNSTDVFNGLTLAVAKAHGITRVPIAPNPKAVSVQERLADAELRGKWIYRDLKPYELVDSPLRQVDVRRMGKIGKSSSVLKWLMKVTVDCEVASSEPLLQELTTKDLPTISLQVPGFEGSKKALTVGGDWQQLKKQSSAAISQTKPPPAHQLTQENLLQQQKSLKSPVTTRSLLGKRITSGDPAPRKAQHFHPDRPPASVPAVADGYAFAFPTPEPTPRMANNPPYAFDYQPAYREVELAAPQYAYAERLPFLQALPPPHQPYGAVSYDNLAGYGFPYYADAQFRPSLPQVYSAQWPISYPSPAVQSPMVPFQPTRATGFGHKRQREAGLFETDQVRKRVQY